MKHRACGILVALGAVMVAGMVKAADVTPVYTDDDKTATLTVDAGETNTLSVVFDAAVTNIVKKGAGALQLSVNQSADLKAKWDIQEGRVIADLQAYFGTSASVYVGKNATLDSISASASRIGMTLAGTVETKRAGGITGKFDPIYLDGDSAKIDYCDKHWGIFQTRLYMYGNPLTVKGNRPSSTATKCEVGLRLAGDNAGSPATIYDPADITVDGANLCVHGTGPIYFGNTTGHTEKPADASVILKNGGYFSMTSRGAEHAFPMGIRASGSGRGQVVIWNGTSAQGSQSDGLNKITGPITIDNGASLGVWARSGFQTTWTGPIRGKGELYKTGQGALWVTGKVERAVKNLLVERGILYLDHAGLFSVTGSTSTAFNNPNAASYDGVPTILVGNGSVFSQPNSVVSLGPNSNYHGVLEILPGGTVTNCLKIGGSSGPGTGYVRQFGGTLRWVNANAGRIGEGAAGYGVYMITNGEMRCATDTCFSIADNGTALYYQRGGNSYPDYSMNLGQWGGKADIYVSAGTFYDKNSAYCGQGVSANSVLQGGHGTLTLDGPTADAFFYNIAMKAKGGHFTAQVNVRNGGVFRPTFISRDTTLAANPNCHFYLTADGGTFKRTTYTGDWHKLAGSSWSPADKLVVYKGGVTFDVPASNRWSTSIVAPTGKGIKKITLPADVTNQNGYPGPAKITITSGAGAGATAVCDYEPLARTHYTIMGRQKGVIVTCPGWDYTDEGGTLSVTCKVAHANALSTNYLATVELEENDRSGGLCKVGNGQLVIASSGNTYEGETCVSNGTLIVESGANLPAASTVRVCSASLAYRDSNVTVVSNLVVDGHAWISSYGIKIGESLTFDAGHVMGNKYLQVPGGLEFAEGTKLVVKNAGELKARKLALDCGGGEIVGFDRVQVVDENGGALEGVRAVVSSDKHKMYLTTDKGLMLLFK